MAEDWSRAEVEAAVTDYFAMLAAELRGEPYNKAAHRRELVKRLSGRSAQSVEFKHANVSAVLIELGVPYIAGYKPRSNYQQLLAEAVAERLAGQHDLVSVVAQDASEVIVPSLDDILNALVEAPTPLAKKAGSDRPEKPAFLKKLPRPSINYLEQEARNRALGRAGEEFVLHFEQARLLRAGKEKLASEIVHVSKTEGDGAGFDILSFDESGDERPIEVKTTKYGKETPFFVSRNEVTTSEARAAHYHLYRVFDLRARVKLFTVRGPFSATCELEPSSYLARVA